MLLAQEGSTLSPVPPMNREFACSHAVFCVSLSMVAVAIS